MRRDKKHVTRRVTSFKVEEWRVTGRSKKRWIDCARQDVKEMDLSDEID
jgi:hypothetical protein